MRISDWSSDVCSSDLPRRPFSPGRLGLSQRGLGIDVGGGRQVRRTVGENEGHPLAGRDGELTDTPEAFAVERNRAVQHDHVRSRHRLEAAIVKAADRKSVGLGKSVSVRVDTGGHRTLKKKTEKREK